MIPDLSFESPVCDSPLHSDRVPHPSLTGSNILCTTPNLDELVRNILILTEKQAIFPESDMVVYVPKPNHTVTVTQCEPCNVTYATSLFIPLKATDISPLHSPVFILRSTFRSSRQPQLY